MTGTLVIDGALDLVTGPRRWADHDQRSVAFVMVSCYYLAEAAPGSGDPQLDESEAQLGLTPQWVRPAAAAPSY